MPNTSHTPQGSQVRNFESDSGGDALPNRAKVKTVDKDKKKPKINLIAQDLDTCKNLEKINHPGFLIWKVEDPDKMTDNQKKAFNKDGFRFVYDGTEECSVWCCQVFHRIKGGDVDGNPFPNFNQIEGSVIHMERILLGIFQPYSEIPALIDSSITRDRSKNWQVIARVLDDLRIGYRFNIRSQTLEINIDQIRVNQSEYDPKGWIPLEDLFDGWLRSYMNDHYRYKRLGKKTRAVALSFYDNVYNREINALSNQSTIKIDPFLEYLKYLKWDGKERLKTVMDDLFGCVHKDTNDAQVDEQIRKKEENKAAWFGYYIFCGAVLRTLKHNRGFKLDGIPIITGGQGLGKSSFLEHILPEALRMDLFTASVDLSDDDAETILMTIGKAIVEVSELSGIFGKELAAIKKFVARPWDHYRPKYGKKYKKVVRSWIVIGTADRTGDILPADSAGNRRWPVLELRGNDMSVKDRMKWIDDNRDQLWAEAFNQVTVKKDRNIFWDEEMQQQYKDDHQTYEKRDESLEVLIEERLDGRWMKIQDIAVKLDLIRDFETLDRKTQNRLAAALRMSGYENCRKTINGKKVKGWDKIPF